MAKEVFAGIPTTIRMRFVRNGTPVVFTSAPLWNIINTDNEIILNGSTSSTATPGEWSADITIPEGYLPSDNNPTEDLILEFYGKDDHGVVRSAETELTLVDNSDDYLPEGVIYYSGEAITDRLSSTKPISSVSARIENIAGQVVSNSLTVTAGTSKQVRNKSDVPDRFSPSSVLSSYITDISIPAVSLPETTGSYLLIYTINYVGGGSDRVMHQLYWTNNRILNLVMQMRNYLDKARLTEVDPTLQWWDSELVMSTIEGLNYINGHAPVITYWRPSDLPQALHTHWYYASLLHALNMRYLAEGMTNFEFTGLNTTVNVDRREAISYKIEELRGYLDRLEIIKKSAVTQAGAGTPDATVGTTSSRSNIAVLGIRVNPANNALSWYGRRNTRFRTIR